MKNLVLIIREFEPSFDYHSTAFRKLSHRVRKSANWRCEQCGINLSNDHLYLDAHHIWGTQYNSLSDIEALCIGCHAEQPGNGHLLLKNELRYQEFMRRYGKRWKRLHAYLNFP
ncbi:MAG: hypothetical protein OXH39_04600 [Candidatus Poribacteria bacterium]|nr:hypothetical protein [Candidatus Poribacteria bacterium]